MTGSADSRAACSCGAPSPCVQPPHADLGPPGDYVVAPSVAAAVEAEVQFNLRHYSPERGRVIPPGEPFAHDENGDVIAVTDEAGTVHILPLEGGNA